MKRLFLSLAGAGLALLTTVAVVAAVEPSAAPAATPAPITAPGYVNDPIDEILGLTSTQVMDLRQDGLSLAQIAERQNVDPQKLIDALVVQWSGRIDARLAVGALTADQAAALKANLAVEAKAMVNQATIGGMRGAAVGAGPNGAMRGMHAGAAGTTANGTGWMGGGRGALMRGVAGTGTCAACAAASPTPAP
jgi:hypothetical protein